jgi:hypothetical protein
MRSELVQGLDNKILINSNEEIYKETGFILADGRSVNPKWGIHKKETLKDSGFEKEIPNLQGRLLRLPVIRIGKLTRQ